MKILLILFLSDHLWHIANSTKIERNIIPVLKNYYAIQQRLDVIGKQVKLFDFFFLAVNLVPWPVEHRPLQWKCYRALTTGLLNTKRTLKKDPIKKKKHIKKFFRLPKMGTPNFPSLPLCRAEGEKVRHGCW